MRLIGASTRGDDGEAWEADVRTTLRRGLVLLLEAPSFAAASPLSVITGGVATASGPGPSLPILAGRPNRVWQMALKGHNPLPLCRYPRRTKLAMSDVLECLLVCQLVVRVWRYHVCDVQMRVYDTCDMCV